MTETDLQKRVYRDYGSFVGRRESPDLEALQRWGRPYDHWLRGWVPSNCASRAADIGCGTGGFLVFLRDRGFSDICGVDLASRSLENSRRLGFEVEEGDGTIFLQRRPKEFDLLTAFDVIEHLERPEILQFLAACVGALKPGGRLILQTPNADSPFGPSTFAGDFSHRVLLNPASLAGLLRVNGFTEIEMRETAPVAFGYGAIATVRAALWRVIRCAVATYDLIETGSEGCGIRTRTFLASARRPLEEMDQ